MSIRRPADSSAEPRPAARDATPASPRPDPASRPPAREPEGPPRSRDEAEARYITARDAWTSAMRAANSGRPADLASLALTQETYEAAAANVALWRSGAKMAVPIEPAEKRAGLDALIGQEMAWRRVHEVQPKQPGPLRRLARKLTRRG